MAAAAAAAKLLKAARQTVTFAETSAGGAIASRLLAVPGASARGRRGLIQLGVEGGAARAGGGAPLLDAKTRARAGAVGAQPARHGLGRRRERRRR